MLLIYCIGAVLGGTLSVVAVRTIRRRLRIFTFICIPMSLWLFGMALGIPLLGVESGARLIGCSLLAAIATAVGIIFVSWRTRSRKPSCNHFPVNPWFDVLGGVAFFLTLCAVFYGVENWRGKRAWKQCQREIGTSALNWHQYIPPPVLAEQNFFKAPKMAEWFGGFYGKAGPPDEAQRWSKYPWNEVKVADVVVLPVVSNTNSGNADIVLEFDSLDPRLFATNAIPTLVFDGVPLRYAITNLARQARIKFVVDPDFSRTWPNQREPQITERFDAITAFQALRLILNQSGLRLVSDPKTGMACVTAKTSGTPGNPLSPKESREMKEVLQTVIGENAIAREGYPLLVKQLTDIKPARIVLHSQVMPDDAEIADLFRRFFPGERLPFAAAFRIKHTSFNAVEVILKGNSASDYLEWSDQFQTDFDLIRAALKRPYARMDNDNNSARMTFKVPNTIACRSLAGLLRTRATCHLLLNQPDEALSDLTFLNDSRSILETWPTTLVDAMMNVVICSYYVDEIARGIRLGVWRERQLKILEEQLGKINMLPELVSGLRMEQATSTAFELADFKSLPEFLLRGRTNLWQKLRYPGIWMLQIAPQGWTEQNRVVVATLRQKQIQSVTATDGFISPMTIDTTSKEIASMKEPESPFNLIARNIFSDLGRAVRSAAYRQTMINQAQIACALERYRQLHGDYPPTLNMLVPEFIAEIRSDIIDGRPLHYRRKSDREFLLYSVGWNETDDGGQIAHGESVPPDNARDWAWSQ